MLELSRDEAESVIRNRTVRESSKWLQNSVLTVSFKLSGRKLLLVAYDTHLGRKSYFLADTIRSGNQTPGSAETSGNES